MAIEDLARAQAEMRKRWWVIKYAHTRKKRMCPTKAAKQLWNSTREAKRLTELEKKSPVPDAFMRTINFENNELE